MRKEDVLQVRNILHFLMYQNFFFTEKVEHNKASMILTHIFPLLHKVDQEVCNKFLRKFLTMSGILQDHEKLVKLSKN
jgi:hypothetical protein